MIRINRRLFSFILCLCVSVQSRVTAVFDDHQMLDSLSIDEKIGQLFMVAAAVHPEVLSKVSVHTENEVMGLIEDYHIGGIIYLGYSDPEQQLAMTQRLKTCNSNHNKIELWVGLDAEWGPAMRLDSTIKFPYNLLLGAIQDDNLIYELGCTIGEQLKLLGIAINFAPVADINTNPNNPIINCRSFGQDPVIVSSKALAYAQGLRQTGVMPCAKHFPGHGDTAIDSHKGLPVINHSLQRLEAVELYPFKQLIDSGIEAIMVGHLLVPIFDNQMPATLSYKLTTNLLKKQYHFNGLVITDALDMQGATDICQQGLIELRALQAGADLLLVPIDVPKAAAIIKQAISEGNLSLEELDEHVLKIIHAKRIYAQHVGCSPDQIIDRLNASGIQEFSKKLYQKAMTIVRNKQNSIPLAQTSGHQALLLIGPSDLSPFATELGAVGDLPICYLAQTPSDSELGLACAITKDAKTVIVGLAGLTYQAGTSFGVSPTTLHLIKGLQAQGKQVILVLFGNPYALTLFEDIPGLVEAYEDHPYAQQAAAQIIMGAIKAEGRLPITA